MPETDVAAPENSQRPACVVISAEAPDCAVLAHVLRGRDLLVLEGADGTFAPSRPAGSVGVLILDVDPPRSLDQLERIRDIYATAELVCIGDASRAADLGVMPRGRCHFDRPIDIDAIVRRVMALVALDADGARSVRHRSPVPRREFAAPRMGLDTFAPPAETSGADHLEGAGFSPFDDLESAIRVAPPPQSPELLALLEAAEQRFRAALLSDPSPARPMEPADGDSMLLPAHLVAVLDEPLDPEEEGSLGGPTTGAATGSGLHHTTSLDLTARHKPTELSRPTPVPSARLSVPTPVPPRVQSIIASPSLATMTEPRPSFVQGPLLVFPTAVPVSAIPLGAGAAPIPPFSTFHLPPPAATPSLSTRVPGLEPLPSSAPVVSAPILAPSSPAASLAAPEASPELSVTVAPPGARPPARPIGSMPAAWPTVQPISSVPSTRLPAQPPAVMVPSGLAAANLPVLPATLRVEGDAVRAIATAIAARSSGVLVLGAAGALRRILLREGDIVTAVGESEDETLVSFLVTRGDLSRNVATRLLAKLPPFGRHAGAALIAHGHLGQEDLWPVLRAHAEWILGRTVVTDVGSCVLEVEVAGRLKAEPNVFGGSTGAEIIIEALRRAIPPEVALKRIGGVSARLTDGQERHLLAECALPAEEEELVRGAPGRTVGEILEGREPEVANVLYALTSLAVLEALTPSRQEASEPTGDDPLDAEALRQRVELRMAVVNEGDYFALLGVSKAATGYEIRRAYLDLRRSFEPTRVLTGATADLADDLRTILEVLDEAYDILREPSRRERYRRAIEAGPPA